MAKGQGELGEGRARVLSVLQAVRVRTCKGLEGKAKPIEMWEMSIRRVRPSHGNWTDHEDEYYTQTPASLNQGQKFRT